MFVEVTDVFLRDGLQDEHGIVSTEDKLDVAQALADAGVPRIEAASFVNPRRVPQMADAAELFARRPADAPPWSALVLNGRGIARAIDCRVDEIQVVVSASAAHSAANAGRTPEDAAAEIVRAIADVRRQGRTSNFFAGISTAFTCPFEGEISAERVIALIKTFSEMGIQRVGLADTIGTTSTDRVISTMTQVIEAVPDVVLSLHLHDSLGQALQTASAAVAHGITRFDAAVGGYGGCPAAPGAAGNLDTIALVRHLHSEGHETGIDVERLQIAVDLAHSAVRRAAPILA